ncbi:MAG TPA: hypothetical protein VKZ88_03845 [Fibrobacteria bacterium]|nr:hypothetical protein [Fibrobacteria bacterium]
MSRGGIPEERFNMHSPVSPASASSRHADDFAPGTLAVWLKTLGKTSPVVYLAIFLFINLLFAIKYGTRVGLAPWESAPLFTLCFGIQIVAGGWLALWVGRRKRATIWVWAALGVYLVAAYAVYRPMDPYALDADRWSALEAFFDALFRGDFPWAVKSHLGTNVSLFPGMQVLAMPFYLMGDVGLLQFASLIAFGALVLVRYNDRTRPFFLLGLLIAMPAIQYQVFVRSDLLGNAVAIAWLMHVSLKPGVADGKRLFVWAILWGLALSTRAIFVIPFIYVGWRLVDGRRVKTTVMFGLAAAATFAATFLPFYLWDAALFWERNPYHVQSGYVTREVLVLVLAATIATGFVRRRTAAAGAFVHTGMTLFLTILVCWILKAFQEGWSATLWEHQFDITYFSLCLPFLVIALGDALFSRNAVTAERMRV